MSPLELVMIALLALMLFSPRELPAVIRSVAKFWASIRRTADDFRDAILQDEEVRRPLEEVRRTIHETRTGVRRLQTAAEREVQRARQEVDSLAQKLAADAKRAAETGRDPRVAVGGASFDANAGANADARLVAAAGSQAAPAAEAAGGPGPAATVREAPLGPDAGLVASSAVPTEPVERTASGDR